MRKKRDGKIKKFESEKLKIYENLNNNLKIVSQRFQGFSRMFGFDGLLELNFGQEDEDKNDNDENDFNSGKFLMNIFVKFRANDALRKLSASRQSGGEKSLTTVLFLLALHDNNTPFKLVDEINQGMDSNNEKRVFEVLKTMSETSQFFIITPKLLHDFSYPENCLVTILYGGENMKVLEKYVSSK
ncbi:SMC5 [Hepatospora eriocheir]|uniref:Structural maintenance of chromosomes protein 5 n=1 Tax=Hepatospora eriocheir TaxID=1081669 RepID=A0A1X0QG29_9MICR|nr:SMC5 [Hepatospora eriocheir]